MTSLLSHTILGEHFILNTHRILLWEKERTLVVADLHVGKSGHFRKSGIGIPQTVYKDDLHRLLSQILFFKAERLIIAGDLTHSSANRELDLFRKWRKDFSSLDVHLVKGNHDILLQQWYEEADITVHPQMLRIHQFVFLHDVTDGHFQPEPGSYAFSGHLHPGIVLKGKGRQSLRFPCYYFAKNHCVLPAFSRFTGSYGVQPAKGETAIAITPTELIPLHA
ncbi:MAG TPA: ligase-associated DNA damage response endonuclease PdeM [Chitinophagaceae bacterium]|nr:ligase-associated DNA damage response endonuclease PdeM [Chitinophagaceae bacterium]